MTVPAAPTAGEPIAEAWGDVVHDGIVAMEIQSGQGVVSYTSTNVGTLAVTFPHPFASTPIVVASASQHTGFVGFADSISANGCRLVARQMDLTNGTGSTPVGWIAYGPRA